jgi:hypothetical protein
MPYGDTLRIEVESVRRFRRGSVHHVVFLHCRCGARHVFAVDDYVDRVELDCLCPECLWEKEWKEPNPFDVTKG